MSDLANKIGLPLSLANTGGAVQPYIEEGVGSPNGVLTRPQGSLFLRTDVAQLWQNTAGGSAWTQIASGSMGAHFATDTFIYFGDSDNYQIGYVSDIVPYMPVPTPPGLTVPGWLISSTLVDDAPGPGIASAVVFETQSTLATGGALGKISGFLIFGTGSTDAEPGATGGSVGGLVFRQGDALGTVNGSGGVSGDIGDMIFEGGSSDDGVGGSLQFILGNGKTGLKNLEFKLGDSTDPAVMSGDVNFVGRPIPIGSATMASALQLNQISLVGREVTAEGNGSTTPLCIKILTFGAPGGTKTCPLSFGKANESGPIVKGYVTDVKVVKTGGLGKAGDQVVVKKTGALSAICTLSLNGFTTGQALSAGFGGTTFDPTVEFSDGDSFEVQGTQGAGGDCACVVYVTYAQG